MIAEKLGINNGSVQTILKEDLNMWKLLYYMWKNCSESFDEQKQRRVDSWNDWIENAQDSNFLKRMIIEDESWIFLRVWSWNKKVEWRVEIPWFTSHQKSAQESFKSQDHAQFFSIFNICSRRWIYVGYWKSFCKQCEKKNIYNSVNGFIVFRSICL